MIIDSDTNLKEYTDWLVKLRKTFDWQRKHRCDQVVRDWRFEFLTTPKEYSSWPVELKLKYFYVRRTNPDEEFNYVLERLTTVYSDRIIIPMYI